MSRILKYKRFKYEDRYTIQHFLALNYTFTAFANRLGKDRRAVSKEVFKHRFLKSSRNKQKKDCPNTSKPPYVCNDCERRAVCKMNQYFYDSSIAPL